VIWGAADPVLPVAVGESVVRDLGANCSMVTLPGIGHFAVEEAPAVVVPTIAEFLRVP
jgi:pimeloyl-ACP methyl ester carboxylesterase